MSEFNILVLPGDGIGPEVTEEAVKILNRVSELMEVKIHLQYGEIGGAAIDKHGQPLPESVSSVLPQCDAVLLGAVGGPNWEHLSEPPELGLLQLRKNLECFANLRPSIVFPALVGASSLHHELVSGLDLMIFRELTGGIYFGEPRGTEEQAGIKKAFNTMVYHDYEVERIAHMAFQAAQLRNKSLCSVDKANVLEVSKLWRKVVIDVAKSYPDVELTHLYVDNAAMQLVKEPKQFDVLLTGNLFGDILSDIAAMLTGSIGLLPSASLNSKGQGIYEPVHGSAPDIAGTKTADPIAAILSVALMCRYTLKLDKMAVRIEGAVGEVLDAGFRTPDIRDKQNKGVLTTQEMGNKILDAL